MRDIIEAVLSRYSRRERVISRMLVSPVDEIDNIVLPHCDVIIARGYSARKLKADHPDATVVEIDISGYDVIASITECRARFNSRKIAFIGFYNAFNGIKKFTGIFDCGINVYIPNDFSELNSIMRRAEQDGCDAVIGGYSAYKLACARGINAIPLHSGEESVGLALEEAARAVEIIRQERIKAETWRIITQAVKDGMIYADEHGVIRECNLAAETTAGCELKGRPLDDIFPSLASGFEDCMRGTGEIMGEVRQIAGITASLDFTPVVVQGRPSGVVISFQNVARVQQRERQIRKKLSENGLVARHRFSDLVHRSKIIKETIKIAKQYARLPSNILITGETGTGKELFAQSIHNESGRKNGPFVAVNCAALPENLLESELFGYVEGAFTGTSRGGKAGLFELAHNGTLFLDEIAEMPVGLQSKLLRALQEREVRRVGGDKVIAVDVRIISATNSNLYNQVERGLFRRDLLYRLDVFNISLPPLRYRQEDINALFYFFLEKYCRAYSMPMPDVRAEALEMLHGCHFAGNARELRNMAARACAQRKDPRVLTTEDMRRALHPESLYGSPVKPEQALSANSNGNEEERRRILEALASCNGRRGQAAKMLGMNRSTLWRKLRD